MRKREVEGKQAGNVDEAFKTAARVIEAEYEWPFQSHASMGPACAMVEIKDGNATCWTGSQKPHFVHDGVRRTLGLPPDKVHAIWVVGPGSYGRNDADDAAMDAAVLAKATGRPVRVQYMRDQGTGWDPKGPASIHRARAAIDASGNVIAYEFISKGFSRVDVNTNGSQPHDTLAGQFRGVAAQVGRQLRRAGGVLRVRQQADLPGRRSRRCSIAPRRCAPRTCAIRSGRRSTSRANRSWTKWRRALNVDPVEFRLRHVKDAARHRGDQGRGREGGLAVAALAAARPDRQQVSRPRHRLLAAQRHPRARSWPRSRSTARPARSGRASSPSRTTAA